MNIFYLVLFFSITIPIFLKNKKIGLIISFILLFIPWGLQYHMTQDWDIHLLRWQHVNYNQRIELDGGEERILEPLYVLFMKMCKPFSFYGFLIISAILELSVFYYFIKKYVSPNLYWIAIFILMINVKFGLLLIDTNRQTLALLLSMVGIVYLDKSILNKSSIKSINYILLSILFFYLSPKVHSSSNIVFLTIPIYLFARYAKSPNRLFLFLLFNILFLMRFWVDAQQYQFAIYLNWDKVELEGMDFMGKYLDEIENSSGSEIALIIDLFIMNATIYYYNKLRTIYKIFAILWILSFILSGFLVGSLARVTLYFYIYFIVIIPKIIEMTIEKYGTKNSIVNGLIFVMLSYLLFTFVKQMTNETEGYYYYRWNDFQTLFEAPKWI